jgi:predicted RecB family nuclease
VRIVDQLLRLSATDLANHLGCRHLSQQNRAVAEGRLRRPRWNDPIAAILRERGLEHEAGYLRHLRRNDAVDVVEIRGESDADTVARTRQAMRAGVDLIYQAALSNDRWHGRADFLRRTPTPSALGRWSYEVIDAKLATDTRATTILQLCVYSELIAEIQDLQPERAYVVAPHHDFMPEPYRLADFTAYYRLVKRRLEEAIALANPRSYPEPVMHCDVCNWWAVCDSRRRADDHLCFVAGISRVQIEELERLNIDTLERLAGLSRVPRPSRGSREALTRVRDQAAIQLKARQSERPQHEILEPVDEHHGLALLPEPSPADVFLDLEGDRLALGGGRDYLFGRVTAHGRYSATWGTSPEEEKRAFEQVMDELMETLARAPGCHLYHFGAYEPNAFKRLASRYATRERELDSLLRANRFVDLHSVVKRSIRASVESYSLKDLEQFHGFTREQDMRAATASRRAIEWAIEMHEQVLGSVDLSLHVASVERYNREDCVSARRLRDWLEMLRSDQMARGAALPRPGPESGDANAEIEEVEEATRDVMLALLDGVPVDRAERSLEQHALWLMAHLLEWHRREDKAAWWEYFRLRELPIDDYEDERSALVGLSLVDTVGGTDTRPVRRYAFPAQEHDIRGGDTVCMPDGTSIGSIDAIDIAGRTVDIQLSGKHAQRQPGAVFVQRNVRPGAKPQALLELGRWIAANGIGSPGDHRAARDLLLRGAPRLAEHSAGLDSGDDEVATARRLALELDHGVLPVQGPPGTGKTFTGSRMIVELVKAGKRVGVTAVSHEVIRNLLRGSIEAAAEEGLDDYRCLHKGKAKEKNPEALDAFDDYKRIQTALASGEYGVLGGTAWLWARPEFRKSVDVLFIDEAGQMSLADVLAVAAGAESLVLLGDPQQLEQPQQASHPPGTEASALEHILGEDNTIRPDAGMFLHETRRLHPAICAFTAEVFYDNRLASYPGLENQAVAGAARFDGAHLVYVPVDHDANQSRAIEEVEAIETLVAELTAGAVHWKNAGGVSRRLTKSDIMIVAPYNAQVTALSGALPDVRVGTVDKFQGQEAPVVIVSLTTSSAEQAPRGMSFLYSANRLNVATSRAKGLCILVGSPRLFEPDCRTPEQMKLANAFCRYLEMARVVNLRPAITGAKQMSLWEESVGASG